MSQFLFWICPNLNFQPNFPLCRYCHLRTKKQEHGSKFFLLLLPSHIHMLYKFFDLKKKIYEFDFHYERITPFFILKYKFLKIYITPLIFYTK